MKIEKAGKIIAAPKFLIFGKTGTGKTTWAAKAPKLLFILAENQGAASIASSNPDALIINVKDWNDFREAAKFISSCKKGIEDNQPIWGSGEEKFQTIVIDSISALQDMAMAEITKDKGLQGDFNLRAPMQIQQWGSVADLLGRVLTWLRNLEQGVICLALAQDIVDESGSFLGVQPLLSGKKVSNQIGSWFNAVGYIASGKCSLKIWQNIHASKPQTQIFQASLIEM